MVSALIKGVTSWNRTGKLCERCHRYFQSKSILTIMHYFGIPKYTILVSIEYFRDYDWIWFTLLILCY